MRFATRTAPLTTLLFTLPLILLVLLIGGCGMNKPPRALDAPITMGVAGFTQPRHITELLAGYIPEERHLAKEKDLAWLDATLLEHLDEQDRSVADTPAVRICQKQILNDDSFEGTALARWVAVGECAGVEFLMAPHLLQWRERRGGDLGVVEPASVMFDLYVINVKRKALVSRGHFEETQSSLLENLLDADTFIERGGRWITARELALEGMAEALEELGF